MNIVYLVTSGEYSNYGVRGVFSTKEKAQEFMDCFGDCEYRIEEEILDPYEYDLKDLRAYDVVMDRQGNVLKIENASYVDHPIKSEIKYTDCYMANTMIKAFICKVLAKNEEHAIKIVNEKRAIYSAK